MYHIVHKDSAIGQSVLAGEEFLSTFPNFDRERFGTAAEAIAYCKGSECIAVLAERSWKTVQEGPNRGVALWRITACKEPA